MMKVLMPLAAGFEEIEAVTVVDVLRRAGAEVVVAGLAEGPCRGSRGIVLVPDATLDAVRAGAFDLIVLPGGAAGAKALAADERVLGLLRAQAARDGWIGAICAAPTVLERAGLLAGRKATAHPTVQDELRARGVDLRAGERVCADGKLVTSQAPGTAMEFAYALVERLFSRDQVAQVDAGVLARS